MIRALHVALMATMGLLLHGSGRADALFFPAETCGFCHSSGGGALVDGKGNGVSIWHDWPVSMMGNAFRDPLFQAKLATEIERSPQLKSVIEDQCTRCHAPMGRTQYYHDGGNEYGLSQTHGSALAHDGVSCALCHQIQPQDLGTKESFSGQYCIEPKREIYGPYEDVFTMPMQHHLDLTPMFGKQIGQSSMCGSCHVLFTPIADASGGVRGEFPEQTVYLEWLNSRYAAEDTRRDCQDCHLRRVDGPVRITRRPPWFDVTREPFRQHTFNGGNRFMLGLLGGGARGLNQKPLPSEFEQALRRTEAVLRNGGSLEILEAKVEGALEITVAVRNTAGHKLPTGYPSRRVWVQLVVKDSSETPLFRSGGWTGSGEILGLDETYEPHHDVIGSEHQVQVYESIMGDREGELTHTLLRAAIYLKDNRLPPLGFRKSGPWYDDTAVAGKAAEDKDFNRDAKTDGTGQDLVHYRVKVGGAVFPLRVEAELLYQTVSPRFVQDLLQSESPLSQEFGASYRQADKAPFTIARATARVDPP